jgi:hypothetical protein
MKRDEMRRLRAHGRNMSTRAVPELPPGPIGVPARSWLKDRSAHSSVTDRTKAGPGAENTSAIGAPRGAPRRDPNRIVDTIGLRFSARHPPQSRGELFDMSSRACPAGR